MGLDGATARYRYPLKLARGASLWALGNTMEVGTENTGTVSEPRKRIENLSHAHRTCTMDYIVRVVEVNCGEYSWYSGLISQATTAGNSVQ